MTGFLHACIQASSIIVALLDTVVTGSIRQEEMSVASPKGVLYKKYLYYVDNDDVLLCEGHRVAHNTATLLSDANLKTLLADVFFTLVTLSRLTLRVKTYNHTKHQDGRGRI